jgi:hypothetical protein
VIDCGAVFPQIYTMISSQNTIFSIYFPRQVFVSIETLSKRKWLNFAFFTLTILSNVVGSVSVFYPKMRDRGYWLHTDNAKSHNDSLSLEKTEEARFTRLPQPPYSLDLAPWDFFLFGYLKKEREGRNFRSENEMMEAVRIILKAIPIRVLSEVFEQWIARLHGCIANGG